MTLTSPTLQRRHVAFYLEEVSGHQTLEVDGSLLVKDYEGNKLGTFPHEAGEPYSWYLCGCAPDPFAWRVKGPSDFECRVCSRSPQVFFVCSCGIVSPAENKPACLWCDRPSFGDSHACRAVGGAKQVFNDTASCPLCGRQHEALRPSGPTPAKIQPPRRPLVVEPPAGVPATDKAPPPPQGGASVPPSSPPVSPPSTKPGEGPAGGRMRRRLRPSLALGLATVVALVVVVGLWISHQSPYSRAQAAFARGGDLLSPAGSSAIDLFQALTRDEPSSPRVHELGVKIADVLRPEGAAALQRLYLESAEDIDWPRISRIYGFLAQLSPLDREVLARKAYCDAHIAFDHRRYDEALAGYRAALEQQPSWSLALNGLGKIYVRNDSPFKNDSLAETYYLQAHRADPKFPFPLLNLAALSMNLDKLDAAASYLREAIAVNPKRANSYRDLGRVLRKQRRYREAVEAYTNALAYETSDDVKSKIQAAINELRAKR